MGKLIRTILHKTVEDVFDLTVDAVHNFIANGILVHNCLNY